MSRLTTLLRRGSCCAFLGAFLILAVGAFLPRQHLQFWGLLTLVFGFGLIAVGLVPYKKLSRMRTAPDELFVTSEELVYKKKGALVLTIPQTALLRLAFIDGPLFGIGVWLNNEEKITVHDHRFDVSRLMRLSQKRFSCDLFLPYFNKKVIDQIVKCRGA